MGLQPFASWRFVRCFPFLLLLWSATFLPEGGGREVYIPSRLLYRMQSALIASGRFIQAVDIDEIEDPLAEMFSRRMMFSISAICESKMGQGQLLDVVNGQATIFIINNLDANGRFVDMGVIAQGGQELFEAPVNETVEIVVEPIQGDNPWQSVEVETNDGDKNATPTSRPSAFFDEYMSVSDIADTCIFGPNNTEDNRPVSSSSDKSHSRSINVMSVENLVTLLPYSELPRVTQVVHLFLTPSVLGLEIVSLFLLFVDLWFAREIQPPKPIPRGMIPTVILVWMATVLVGSITIASFASVHSTADLTYVGCGTWTMREIQEGLIGRYVCQVISLNRTTAWYGYLLYIFPVGVMVVVSCASCFALYVRIRYGIGKNPVVSRALSIKRSYRKEIHSPRNQEEEEYKFQSEAIADELTVETP